MFWNAIKVVSAMGAVLLPTASYAQTLAKSAADIDLNTGAVAEAPEARGFPLDAHIIWSDPPDSFVDTRQSTDVFGEPDGFTEVYVRFDQPVTLALENVEVFGNTDDLPWVEWVGGRGSDWVILLSRSIPPGEAIGIAFAGGVDALIYAAHPGDVNRDGTTDKLDVTALAGAVDSGSGDILSHDFNRDGVVDARDIYGLKKALGTTDIGGEWPEPPGGDRDGGGYACCCDGLGGCRVVIGTQCAGTPATCPCTPNPCPW